MRALRDLLADPAARLITLIGPGGVGKTRLALELARAIADEGAFRVLFVGLAAVRDSAFVAPAIAEALGVLDVTGLDLPRRARLACEGQPTLLVLDNFEHVLVVAPLVADLLVSVAPLRVLATSRAPLRVRGEREYMVGPLALDVDVDAKSPADLSALPPLRLFVERVRDVQPDFRLTAANGPDGDRDLSTARRPAARARAGRTMAESADARGSAPPTHARCPSLDRRPARSPRTPTDDQCDCRLELSTA